MALVVLEAAVLHYLTWLVSNMTMVAGGIEELLHSLHT